MIDGKTGASATRRPSSPHTRNAAYARHADAAAVQGGLGLGGERPVQRGDALRLDDASGHVDRGMATGAARADDDVVERAGEGAAVQAATSTRAGALVRIR
jgi:hypothetical protein